MKLNVDYNKIHKLRDKLTDNKLSSVNLDSSEIEIMLQIFNSTENELYPSKDEIEGQRIRVEALNKLDYDKYRERWNNLISDCTEYENKYC